MAAKGSNTPTVLALRFSAIGDVAMTIPVVYGAARLNPTIRFVVVTRRNVAPIFVNRPANVEVHDVDLGCDRYRGLRGMVRLMGDLRRQYDPIAVADLHDVLRTKVLSLMARLHGIPVAVINKGRADKKRLCRQGADQTAPLKSTTSRYREVFNRLGYHSAIPFEPLFGREGADIAALPVKLPAGPLIGVAPFAAHPGKIYPVERMTRVIELLLERHPDATVYLFGGGADESRRLAEMAARFEPGRVVSLAEMHLGFAREMAIISRLNVMIVMDSANMHLASLTGTPTVSIWGQTHPAAGFCPDDTLPVQRTDLPCRPCSVYGNRRCPYGNFPCLDIDPAAVVDAVDTII